MGPSRYMLKNRCTVYPYIASQDADAGNDPGGNYPAASATAVPCSFQQTDAVTEVDEMGRQTARGQWLVFFGPGQTIAINTRLDLLARDGATVVRSVYATAAIDGGGRGESWQVPCEERV